MNLDNSRFIYIFLVILFIRLSFGLTSCSDDDDDQLPTPTPTITPTVTITPTPTIARLSLNFMNTYGWESGEIAYGAFQTKDSGYVVGGNTTSFGDGSSRICIIKTDRYGVVEWEKVYDTDAEEVCNAIEPTQDDGFIVCGRSGKKLYLSKLDQNGSKQWSKAFDDFPRSVGFSVKQTAEGGYVACGNGTQNNNRFIYAIKVDENGDKQWSFSYNDHGGEYVEVASVVEAFDSGFLFLGTINFDYYNLIYLVKINSLGQLEWTKNYRILYNCWGTCIQRTSDGNYIISGIAAYSSTGERDFCLVKINPAGEVIWLGNYYRGNSLLDFSRSVTQCANGDYVVAGVQTIYAGTSIRALVLRTDPQGNERWHQTYALATSANDIRTTADNGLLISGYSRPDNDYYNSDFLLIKTDEFGDYH